MLRIRLFKVLLPLLFIGVVVLLVWAINAPTPPAPPVQPGEDLSPNVSGGEITEYTLGEDGTLRKSLEFHAERAADCGEDCYEAYNVTRFELPREGQEPLLISSETAMVNGPDGQRKMRFTGPVKISDLELELVIDLPHLDVDEVAGEARSAGALVIEGKGHRTRADRLIYGLGGQATELIEVESDDDEGGKLLAGRAFLHDGLDDVELVQGFRYRSGNQETFRGETSRVVRRADGRVGSLTASGNVVGGFRTDEGILEASSDSLDARFDDAGNVAELILDGRALIEEGARLLAADRLEFRAQDPGPGWSLEAQGAVRMAAPTEEGTARIRADGLRARLDEQLDVIEADARGSVRFEAPDTQADAASARLTRIDPLGRDLQVALRAEGETRARLAQARSRITADLIETDARGESLFASGRVESTLLPQDDEGALDGLFRTDRAVLFISSELFGDQRGNRLTFRGNVRAWQGEQNLSAQEVIVDQGSRSLSARERVTTRFPRDRDRSGAASDEFVQITAAELDYIEAERQAIYRETVRVVLAEGWIESAQLVVTQSATGGGFQRLLAERDVQFEFLGVADDAGDEQPRTVGTGDRLDYLPSQDTLWLYGDEKRAEIQRGGDQAGTSRGKVLTYRLDDGTLSVEGGSISTPSPAAKGKDQETPG